MFSSVAQKPLGCVSQPHTIQVRNFSRRMIAYPAYKAPRLGRTEKKDHRSQLRYQMQCFLGKKNYKNQYLDNRYFEAPQDHRPKYINPRRERGSPLVDFKTGEKLDVYGKPIAGSGENDRSKLSFANSLKPFPQNDHCKTNLQIRKADRREIYQRIVEDKEPIQQVAVSMGIKIPRLEAIVKLVEIENRWKEQNLITPQLKNMASTMYRMFPLFNTRDNKENLTEIPVPERTLTSRFLTVAESEPFGPIEASKIYNLSPAVDLLKNAAEHGATTKVKTSNKNIVIGKRKPTDRYLFEFTEAKVGKVGFRYGTTQRDNKKDRKIDYDASGKMIYALPESG